MKKLLVFALAMLVAAPCFGAVAISDSNETDGEQYVGEATSITIEGQEVSFDGSKVTILANGHKEGVTSVVSHSVNATSNTNLGSAQVGFGVIRLADLGPLNETNGTVRRVSLANGTPGQMITITVTAATGGTLYITDDGVAGATATALLATGWDDLAFNAALDSVTLLYVDDTYGWVVIGTNSVTVT